MLYQSLIAVSTAAEAAVDDVAAVVDAAGVTTWGVLIERMKHLQSAWAGPTPKRVGVLTHPSSSAIAVLAALDAVGHHTFLLDASLDQSAISSLVGNLQLATVVDPARIDYSHITPLDCQLAMDRSQHDTNRESLVTILTSGTEGQPKPATHTWKSIANPVRRGTGQQIWLLAYRAHLYAGLQVMLQSLLNGGTLVMPDPTAEPGLVVRMMYESRVQFASATPSYWRRLLLFAPRDRLAQVPLRQITLGGEAVDQPILDQLSTLFPRARVVHIYATTELGRCFAVSDGRAGFPIDYLSQSPPGAAELKIEEGQLFARSANRMLGYDGQDVGNDNSWIATGDLVEVTEDRAYFAGRIGDMINVGGNKVRPIAVERLIRTIDGVDDLRVYGKSSSVAGQLVACDVVLKAGYEADCVIQAINQIARGNLSAHEIPRIVQIVDVIPTSSAGKVIRGNG